MLVATVRSEDTARTLIAGAVLLFHAMLFLALLWTKLGQQPRPREQTIWLNMQAENFPQATNHDRKERQYRSKQATPFPSPHSPGIPVFSRPSGPNQQNLSGLHEQLFRCAPENLANLDETQRARCRKLGALPVYDPNAVDYADHSDQVPGAKRWKRELARKKAPLLLPCGNVAGIDPIYTGLCLIGTITKGFAFTEQYENQPAYFDKPKKTHVDNNGDPPPMYRDRDH